MEFQVDCFDSAEEANAFMYSTSFSSNPIGVEFDPEAWLDQIRAGVPTSEFLVRLTDQPVWTLRGALASLSLDALAR